MFRKILGITSGVVIIGGIVTKFCIRGNKLNKMDKELDRLHKLAECEIAKKGKISEETNIRIEELSDELRRAR